MTPAVRLDSEPGALPMVSLHVPAHNEPPDMVIDTLRSLLRIDSPSSTSPSPSPSPSLSPSPSPSPSGLPSSAPAGLAPPP